MFTNGTIPLIVALHLLNIKGEVITTPYSFIATAHALWWNRLTPVFVDVDLNTGNIDPNKIESAITPKTTAILPVHVYGFPCDITGIQNIANKYNLKVIYDAAHAFNVQINKKSILNAGNLSSLSFHATKTYNTIEGGALISHNIETKQQIDKIKNFGFTSETELINVGINGKLDEMRSAYGILGLKYVNNAIKNRQNIANKYYLMLKNIPGIKMINKIPNVEYNYSYFPIFVDIKKYGMSRDGLYNKLKKHGIFARRYFYPLISSFKPYCFLPSAKPNNLPIATKLSNSVINL